jgi:hypothetical protein
MHLEIINSILIFNRGVKKLAIKPCKILILIFIWTLIFHCNIGFSQCIDFKTHGTLVVGVICDNGIVLSSDSRASFTCDCPESSTTYAYTDSDRKIFPLGKFQIAVTGNSFIKNEYWEELIIQYNKHNKNDSILHSIFHNFKIFVQKKLALTA